MYCIPVLGPHLVGYLESPVPIIIGINTSKISKSLAFNTEQSKVILDIDSNIIYSTNKNSLCYCIRNTISLKLQLIKTYYYVHNKRIRILRRVEMENQIDDKEFVEKARKLLETDDKDLKQNIFVDLIRQIFFSVFVEGFGDIEELFVENDYGVEFNRQKFLENHGKCKKCGNSEF